MRMTPIRPLFLALLPILLIGLAGCGKPPVEEIAAAEAAIRDARQAGAPELAPEAFRDAETAMAETYRLNDAKDYDGARAKAIETRQLAERARDLAQRARQQRETEARRAAEQEGDGGRLPRRSAEETRAQIESSEIGEGAMGEGTRVRELDPVLFDFDDYAVREGELDKVRRVADWLDEHPSANVRLEGHTDERGSADYNLTLGSRRADSVRQLLISYGVDSGRIGTHSFGEEMPAVVGHDESAWSRNRRVEFVLQP